MLKKTFVPAVITGAMLTGAAQLSLADAVATSYLNVYDFSFTNDAGERLTLGVDIVFTSAVTNDGDTYANLNGVIDQDSRQERASPEGLDVGHSCVGDCVYVENSFDYIDSPAPATSNYVVGDVLLTGAVVDFPGPIPTESADAKTLAEVALADPDNAGTAAGNNVGVQGTFMFTPTFTGDVGLSFLADQYIRARLGELESGIDANASTSWSLNISNGDTGERVLRFSPDELNDGISATSPGQDFLIAMTGEAFSTSVAVVAGQRYQLTIDHASDANARLIRDDIPVPAPASLALFGIGLLGLGAIRRRKSGA